ncbi:MAG: hypothetical protein IPL83_09755 [Bdellovibrionales bacterium]|nr:hypothetical protein [Bdellovibrionales bacterium]
MKFLRTKREGFIFDLIRGNTDGKKESTKRLDITLPKGLEFLFKMILNVARN